MVRIKGGTTANKTRRNVLKAAKGFRFGRSTKEAQARTALYHAGNNAFAHRRRKKGDFRRLWNQRISGALMAFEMSYSKFIGSLNGKGISVNRKMLQEIAQENPESFARIVEQTKK